MDTPVCLVADIGTSSIKAGIIDCRGNLAASSRVEIPYVDNRFDTLHPRELIQAFRSAVLQLPNRDRISAIAVSGNGPTLIPINSDGDDLGCVLMWLDKREKRIENTRSFFLPKAAWLRQNQPDVFSQTRTMLSCAEYLQYYLTDELHTASPSDEFDGLFWAQDDLESYRIQAHLFPPFLRPGETIAPLQNGLAESLGLPAGAPCIAAGSDFLMSLLGTATVEPGLICDRAGSSEGINYCSAQELHDSRLRTLPHVIPGYYNVAGILSSTGLLFEWFRRFAGMQDMSYAAMLDMIARSKQPVPWFFPTLHTGASWEFHHGMFYGLGADHGAAEMGRAVVESIGFAVRETVDILAAALGDVQVMRACGGQARNVIWNQMKADMAGVAIEVPQVPEAELMGNAICCFVALGEYSTLSEAAGQMVKIAARYTPDTSTYQLYSEEYRKYSQAYQAMRRAVISEDTVQQRFQ